MGGGYVFVGGDGDVIGFCFGVRCNNGLIDVFGGVGNEDCFFNVWCGGDVGRINLGICVVVGLGGEVYVQV